MRRLILRIMLGLIVLAIVAGALLLICMDRAAGTVITEGVAAIGETPCTIEQVEVSLRTGCIGIDRFRIMNPDGYSPGAMLDIERGDVDMRVASLWNQPVHIYRLELTRPVIHIEAGAGGSNMRVVLDAIDRNLGLEDLVHVRVDKLVVRDAVICIGSSDTENGLLRISLGDAEFENIHGEDNAGITVGELSALVLTELTRKSLDAGLLSPSDLVPPELIEGIEAIRTTYETIIGGPARRLLNGWDDVLESPTTMPATSPSSDPRN